MNQLIIKLKFKIFLFKRKVFSKLPLKKIYYFGIPLHSNLGDNAQTYCTIKWLKQNYRGYLILKYTSGEINSNTQFLNELKKKIKHEDRIFIQSGYNTTDLYTGPEKMHRNVLSTLRDKKIVLLPQTVFYQDSNEEDLANKAYNENNQSIFLARDNISYQKAKEMFYNFRVYLYPDIVTSLIGTRKYMKDRNGILFCLRNDKEAFYTKDQIEILSNKLKSNTDILSFTDTTLNLGELAVPMNIKRLLNKVFSHYSKYNVVITDRYHGTIFSLIANTPVVILSSSDHKLSSGVEWFKGVCDSYVKYAKDIDEAYEYASHYLKNPPKEPINNYFKVNYYDNLKNLIENGGEE